MNKIIYDLILKLEQCDDKHNRCDYLLEHDEITYLLEFIKPLYEKDKEIEKLKEEIKTLYRYTPEKGFELVGDEDVKD